VHRRLVRQAIGNALAPVRKVAEREGPVLTKALQGVIDGWLGGDREVPRKQHHTGRRIFQLLQGEYGYPGAESTVRRYIGRWRRELSLGNNAFVPQIHCPGEEGEVDWYEAVVVFPWGEERVQFFQMRACVSWARLSPGLPETDATGVFRGACGGLCLFWWGFQARAV
jgi:hypothetical protein